MTKLEKFLIGKGYNRYRQFYNKKDMVYKLDESGYSFSSIQEGHLDYRYVKDEDFSKQIIFGLVEMHKPPTLSYPRPQINIYRNLTELGKKDWGFEVTSKSYYIVSEIMDDSMNLCLKQESCEDIFKAMYDHSITFTYDLREKTNA